MLPKGYWTKYNKTKGIYKITNLTTQKFYIGSSCNIAKRWLAHYKELQNNTHSNSYLQRAWNKYGENDFTFEVVYIFSNKSKVTRKQIQTMEQKYLDSTQCYKRDIGYNICKTALGGGWSLTVDTLKEGKSKRCTYAQYLQIIKLFCDTDIPLTQISKDTQVSLNLIKSIYERKVLYDDTEKYVFKPRIYKWKQIENQYLDLIKQMASSGKYAKEIAKELNVNVYSIQKILQQHNIPLNTQKVKIYQYDLEGNFIQEYNSISEANLNNSITNGKICDVASGKRKTAGGYRWSYTKYKNYLQIKLIKFYIVVFQQGNIQLFNMI